MYPVLIFHVVRGRAYAHSQLVKVTLAGTRVFAGVIMALQLRSAWISLVGPNSRGRCPRERKDTGQKAMRRWGRD